jgi:hypothetical protein
MIHKLKVAQILSQQEWLLVYVYQLSSFRDTVTVFTRMQDKGFPLNLANKYVISS